MADFFWHSTHSPCRPRNRPSLPNFPPRWQRYGCRQPRVCAPPAAPPFSGPDMASACSTPSAWSSLALLGRSR